MLVSIWAILLILSTTISAQESSNGIDVDSHGYPMSEAKHRRNVFFTGGGYVYSEAAKGNVFANQMYVEQLTPAAGVTKPYPLVFFAGGGLSGVTWLQTPDNRTGWASYFLDKGYAVHLVDTTSVGRSSRQPTTQVYQPTPVEGAEQFFTRPELYPSNYPQAKLHNQWPGEGKRGDPAFDNWFASLVPLPTNNTYEESTTGPAICDLLKRIGPSFLIGHSYGGIFLFVAADLCPDLVQGLFGVEPNVAPFDNKVLPGPSIPTRPYGLTDTPITYDPPISSANDLKKMQVGTDTPGNISCTLQAPPARKLVNIAKVPVRMYTGQASVHILYDHCAAAYLWQCGISTEWILLEDLGILGNGHFSFVEKNNLEIARRVVEPWLERESGPLGFKFGEASGGTASATSVTSYQSGMPYRRMEARTAAAGE